MMVDKIAELASLSKILNKKSDNLNATISSISKKLAALNFGMNIVLSNRWIEYDGITYRLAYGKYRVPVERAGDTVVYGAAVVYQAGDEEWQLGTYNEQNGREDALLRAPREVRIRLLDHIPDLLDAMKEKAEGLVDSIDRAEKLGESL